MEEETTEITLNTKQCAEIALMVYREWKDAMKPPLYAYTQFEDWLHQILANPTESEEK